MIRGKKEKITEQKVTTPFLKQALVNSLCGMSLVLAGFFCVTRLPYAAMLYSVDHDLYFFQVSAREVFELGLPVFLMLMIPCYLTLPGNIQPKSRLVWRALFRIGKKAPGPGERTALRAWLLKFIFLPVMLEYLLQNTEWLVHNLHNLFFSGYSFANIYWLPLNLMTLADVGLYTAGYALEHPRLKNEIRSVDATFLGWAVCLACYPPFNYLTSGAMGWSFTNYPAFHHPWVQALAGSLMIMLMTVYVLSALALNLKASNLTHRGIVVTGPFRWVRHPAYAAKLLTWYIGSVPVLLLRWNTGAAPFMATIGSMAGWSVLYYLRAVTEERHLSADPVYQEYRRKVTTRFIPGVF